MPVAIAINVIPIDGYATPNFSGEKVPEELRGLLLSRTWVEERKRKWGEDSAIYQAKVRGRFPDISDDTLIPLSWIERARERDLEPAEGAEVQIAADIARFGSDETVIASLAGYRVRVVDSAFKEDTMRTTGRIVHAADELAPICIKVDAVGVGGGVVDRLVEVDAERVRAGQPGLPEIVPMSAGSKPIDEARFVNLRAEWYWNLREHFEHDRIDIAFEDEELAEQCSNIKYKLDSRGRVLLESKDEMRKRGVSSPDRADAIAMAFGGVPDYEEEILLYFNGDTGELQEEPWRVHISDY